MGSGVDIGRGGGGDGGGGGGGGSGGDTNFVKVVLIQLANKGGQICMTKVPWKQGALKGIWFVDDE